MKCEYCGKKIGLLAVRYTWLEKANKRAMHDKCFEKYKKEQTEKIEQTNEEKQVQKEETKLSEKMIKSKIIGVVLLVFTSYFVILYFFSLFVTRTGNSISNMILNSIMCVASVLIGMELVDIKKEGIYNKLLLICGIILLVIYVIWLITIAFNVTLW